METGPSPIKLSIIAAIADNGVIGRGGKLPWRLSSDLRQFRERTMGHPVIMGAKTFKSLRVPLDGRDTIVVTSAPSSIGRDELFFAPSLEAAVALGKKCAALRGGGEIFVIGGARLFAEALPLAHRLYLTLVHGLPEGDVRWEPELGPGWTVRDKSSRAAGERDEYPVTDIILERSCA